MAKRRPPSRPAGTGKGRGNARGRRSSFGRFLLLLVVGIALFALGAYFGERLLERGRALAERASHVARPVEKGHTVKPSKPAKPPSQPTHQVPEKSSGADQAAEEISADSLPRARVAIVVDDLGRDLAAVERLLALKLPLSYAVLPFEPRSRAIAALLEKRGAEILVHLPMAPRGDQNPGPGALVEGMSSEDVAATTNAALDAIPAATGVNNHMGSAATADRNLMGEMLAVLAERKLFFLDSRTSTESVGYQLARERGIPTARRDLFLDDVDERGAIEAELDRLVERARSRGAAIGIVHPRAASLEALEAKLPAFAVQGVELVPVSFLLERTETLPE